MPTVEIPHATDREGREMWNAYERRKDGEFALDLAKEYRMSKSERPYHEWLKAMGLAKYAPEVF